MMKVKTTTDLIKYNEEDYKPKPSLKMFHVKFLINIPLDW